MAGNKKTIKLRPRKCKFCTSPFVPSRPQDKDAIFCTNTCRLSFHKGGTKEYQRLMSALVAELTQSIRETAFSKVVEDQMRAIREEIDAAVSEAMVARYNPEKIADTIVQRSGDVILAEVNRQIVARKVAEAQDAPEGSE